MAAKVLAQQAYKHGIKPAWTQLRNWARFAWSKKYPNVYNKKQGKLETLYGSTYKNKQGGEMIKTWRGGHTFVPKGTHGSHSIFTSPRNITSAAGTTAAFNWGFGGDGPPTSQDKQQSGAFRREVVKPHTTAQKIKVAPAPTKGDTSGTSGGVMGHQGWKNKSVNYNIGRAEQNYGGAGYHRWKKSSPAAQEFRKLYQHHKAKGSKVFTWKGTGKKYRVP
tara:strand:- start:221 stop:880 length:660 start_codon:yes stop_codon:yes gene_type:complete